jgi:hypothetical protein
METVRIGIVLVALASVLAACNPQPDHGTASVTATPSGAPSNAVPPLRITGQGTNERPIRIDQQQGNRRQYELLANHYVSRTAQGLAHATFYDAAVTFYDAKTGKTLVARAPRAILDEAAKTVTLLDGVTSRTSNGQTLRCRRLVYRRDIGTLHGEGDVRMTDPSGMTFSGTSFDSDDTFENIRMQ